MPEINLDNDDHTYKVQVKNKATVWIDVLELSAKMIDMGITEENDATTQQIVEGVKAVAWCDAGDSLESLTDYEICAVGLKVLRRMEVLGKELGPRLSSPASMDSGQRSVA